MDGSEVKAAENRSAPPPSSTSGSAPPAHQMDADEDDENVRQLGDCSALYLALQECLIQTDRDWRRCQAEVQALKACHARRSK